MTDTASVFYGGGHPAGNGAQGPEVPSLTPDNSGAAAALLTVEVDERLDRIERKLDYLVEVVAAFAQRAEVLLDKAERRQSMFQPLARRARGGATDAG